MPGTLYPAKIDNNLNLPDVVDGVTAINAEVVNRLKNTIIAVEKELGVKPSGVHTTVRHRLDSLELLLGIFTNLTPGLTPQPGDTLVWSPVDDGYGWVPGIINSFEANGDLDGDNTSQIVIGLQTYPISTTAPVAGQSLVWDGYAWTPTTITSEVIGAAFSINSFATAISSGLVEVGQTVSTPAFTATYSETPVNAILTDSVPNTAKDVTSTPASFTSNSSFVRNTYGATVTFTLTASNDANSNSRTANLFWTQKVFFGVGAAGQNSEAFIESLTGALATSRSRSFAVNAGASQKIYYAYRTAYGAAPFTVGGFEGGFTLVSTTISITNAFGFTENYTLYESDNVGLGSTTVVVT